MLETAFIVLSILSTLVFIVLALYCGVSRVPNSKPLGAAIAFAALVLMSYLASVLSRDYLTMSLTSSIYFCGMDFMLFSIAIYFAHFTGLNTARSYSPIKRVYVVLGAVDLFSLLSNVFTKATIVYVLNPAVSSNMWLYSPLPPYFFHLAYTYSLVGLVFGMLLYKIGHTPRAYHGRYIPSLLMMSGIVLLNACFLFVRDVYVDYSLLFYVIAILFMCWVNFYYQHKALLKRTQNMVISELGHPIVLFDCDKMFCLCNEAASEFVPEDLRDSTLSLMRFIEINGLTSPLPLERLDSSRSFTWQHGSGETNSSYQCNYKVLTDNRGRLMGYLLVFIDNSLEVDPITGFVTKAVFLREINAITDTLPAPATVALFDLNRLMALNKECGREAGDNAIRILADKIKSAFPDQSIFARMDDANLLVCCGHMGTVEAHELSIVVSEQIALHDVGIGPLEMQCAVSSVRDSSNAASLAEAIRTCERSLKAQKMLDHDSSHSSLLDSLAQALRECDGTTESHVQRTRVLGEMLGKRLGLSDYELSSLALLCLLHDIGKLGIPLEILNKPGMLSDEEWDLMKSHVEKGYRIAMASDELRHIAPYIRHHHECWDGTGYPDGLQFESIPMLSRIIAIVDTYDAMVNDRPYRDGISSSDACAELMRCAGTQFDPLLVSEFVDMLIEDGRLDREGLQSTIDLTAAHIRPRGLEATEYSDSYTSQLTPVRYTEYILDSDNKIIKIDDEFTVLTGYTIEDIEAYNLTQIDLLFPEDRSDYRSLTKKMLESKQRAYVEHRIMRKDGSERFVLCYGVHYFSPVNQEPRSRIIATDITNTNALNIYVTKERNSARRSLDFWEQGARTDSLTGALNHETFKYTVSTMLKDRSKKTVLAMVDADNFKEFNDTYGHPRGDELLKTIASVLKANVPEDGFVGRLGGDEFAAAVQCELDTDDDTISGNVESLWNNLMQGVTNESLQASVSIGAACCSGCSFDELYSKADDALYDAKHSGRATWRMNL